MDGFASEDDALSKNGSGDSGWKIGVAGFDTPSTSPKARAGHGMVRYRNRLYLFGGYSEGTSSPYDEDYNMRYPYASGPHYNTVHEFNLDTRRWKELVTTSTCGNMPRCRRSCSIVVYGGSLYIFGGITSTNEQLNDMWEFSIENCTWSQVEYASGTPGGRSEQTAIVYEDRMYIFGGYDGKRKLNETYVFDFFENTWTSPPSTIENAPSRRCKHTAVLYCGGMYVLGGFQRLNAGNRATTDLHRLDLNSLAWTPVDTPDDIDERIGPEALQLHCCVGSEKDDCLYIIGGKVKKEDNETILSKVLYSYHFHTHAWEQMEIVKGDGCGDGQESTTARQRHTAISGSAENSTGEERIFIFGGMDLGKERYFEGLWELRRSGDSESE